MSDKNITFSNSIEHAPQVRRVVQLSLTTTEQDAVLFLPSKALISLPPLADVDEIVLSIKIERDSKIDVN